ncbi:hypothetical protein N7462_007982 [Penicillium macrosclerotiorum]|uniref:uncharacterized protein n=1 Tax=Penicillium macrosclerotiorum TaxID=303699 RepID=UPI00254923D3|nr:uncharacterized protein N7462_007982 [Penicillium macrosclerotiorum]KAJ5679738.1 hypothetical protein N7462_007982 [Penicillium macrosclerotiorum]
MSNTEDEAPSPSPNQVESVSKSDNFMATTEKKQHSFAGNCSSSGGDAVSTERKIALDGEKSRRRLKIMSESHDRALEKVRGSLPGKKVWYLEVIGIHPDMQGRGIGSKVMRKILEYAGTEPIVLECTKESNLSFYKKFGFEVFEEVQLKVTPREGESEAVRMWMMLGQK